MRIKFLTGLGAVAAIAAAARATTVTDNFSGFSLDPRWTLSDAPANYPSGGSLQFTGDRIYFAGLGLEAYGNIRTPIDGFANVRVDSNVRTNHSGTGRWGMGSTIYFDANNWVSLKIGTAGGQYGWVKEGLINGVHVQQSSNDVNFDLRYYQLFAGVELTATEIKFWGSPIAPAVDQVGVTDVDANTSVISEFTIPRPASFTGMGYAIIGKGVTYADFGYTNPYLNNNASSIGYGADDYIDYARIFTDAPPRWLAQAGDWNAATNWSNGVPNAVDAAATFKGTLTAARSVYSDIATTVGTLSIEGANSYVIGGAGALTLQTSSGSAAVNVLSGTHKINLPLTVASDTSLNVSGGAILKISDPVTVNSNKSLASTGGGTVTYESTVTLQSGASISFASSQHLAGLTVGSNATATLAASSGARVLEADTLSISSSGGKVDLKDNKMIFRNQGAGAWNGSNYAGASGLIKSGRNGGTWNGNGLITSMTHATSPNILTTLGVATAGDVGKTTFGGVSVASTDTLVMYTYAGDANLTGKIDADDYFQIDSHYGKTANGAKSYFNGDFNYDGQLNGDDYFIIDSNYNNQSLGVLGAPTAGVTAVPEPVTLPVLTVVAAARAMRRVENLIASAAPAAVRRERH